MSEPRVQDWMHRGVITCQPDTPVADVAATMDAKDISALVVVNEQGAVINRGDFLNFIPIVILSGVTIFCHLAVIPGLFARKDTAMGAIAVLTALILSLAARGILATGAH